MNAVDRENGATTTSESCLLSGIAIELDRVNSTRERVRSDNLRPVVESFARNVQNVVDLVALPHFFAALVPGTFYAIQIAVKAMHRTGNIEAFFEPAKFKEARGEVESAIRQGFENTDFIQVGKKLDAALEMVLR